MAVFFFEPGLMGLGLRQAQPQDGPRFGMNQDCPRRLSSEVEMPLGLLDWRIDQDLGMNQD